MQLLPALEVGGVERGTLEIASALVARGHRALVVSAGGKLVHELEDIGATHLEYPIGEKRPSVLGTIPRLRRAMIDHEVDVVHARSRLPAWIGHRAIRGLPRTLRPRWVTTVHGPYSVNAYSRVMTSGEKIIAISEFIRDYIRRHYPQVDRSLIKVIPRGIDRTIYPFNYQPPQAWLDRWHVEYPALGGKQLLVLPGRLTRWKGQTLFIELIDELIKRKQAVHGLIAGGASRARRAYERELRAMVSERKLDQHITFLGLRDDMREVLANSSIAYSLTLEPEAFGRTTIEALSLGTPVIGFEHGGTGEILRAVFPRGCISSSNIDEAVARTCELLASPIAVPVTHPYTLERMQSETLNVYRSLCPDRNG